jgi:HD-GYP domain-containing protein (c-di-GMP phosphodiesterase class II)
LKKKSTCHHKKEIINTLTTITSMIDPHLYEHGKNVARYAVLLGKALGLSPIQLDTLYLGALFHDIGKLGIPFSIIHKKGPLTKQEYTIVKKHPENSIKVLSIVRDFQAIIPMVRHHHELFGGGGYPDGLAGRKILLEARILAIADAYDAITTTRGYRRAHGRKYAINTILKNTPQQFDPELVEVFVAFEKKL